MLDGESDADDEADVFELDEAAVIDSDAEAPDDIDSDEDEEEVIDLTSKTVLPPQDIEETVDLSDADELPPGLRRSPVGSGTTGAADAEEDIFDLEAKRILSDRDIEETVDLERAEAAGLMEDALAPDESPVDEMTPLPDPEAFPTADLGADEIEAEAGDDSPMDLAAILDESPIDHSDIFDLDDGVILPFQARESSDPSNWEGATGPLEGSTETDSDIGPVETDAMDTDEPGDSSRSAFDAEDDGLDLERLDAGMFGTDLEDTDIGRSSRAVDEGEPINEAATGEGEPDFDEPAADREADVEALEETADFEDDEEPVDLDALDADLPKTRIFRKSKNQRMSARRLRPRRLQPKPTRRLSLTLTA